MRNSSRTYSPQSCFQQLGGLNNELTAGKHEMVVYAFLQISE